MTIEGNKDEAEKCIEIAQNAFTAGNAEKAERFCWKLSACTLARVLRSYWRGFGPRAALAMGVRRLLQEVLTLKRWGDARPRRIRLPKGSSLPISWKQCAVLTPNARTTMKYWVRLNFLFIFVTFLRKFEMVWNVNKTCYW